MDDDDPFSDLIPSGASQPIAAPTGSRITDYGQPNDPTSDSNSRRGIGAFDPHPGTLIPDLSFAASPDVEQQLVSNGIRPKQPVMVHLSDGSTKPGVWDDRTSDKLRGRVDFYYPQGPHPLRGVQVVGFSPFNPDSTTAPTLFQADPFADLVPENQSGNDPFSDLIPKQPQYQPAQGMGDLKAAEQAIPAPGSDELTPQEADQLSMELEATPLTEEAFSRIMNAPTFNLPRPTGKGILPGIGTGLEESAEGLGTLKNINLAGATALMPGPVQKLVGAGFSGGMIKDALSDAMAAYQEQDPTERGRLMGRALAGLTMGAGGAKMLVSRPSTGGASPESRISDEQTPQTKPIAQGPEDQSQAQPAAPVGEQAGSPVQEWMKDSPQVAMKAILRELPQMAVDGLKQGRTPEEILYEYKTRFPYSTENAADLEAALSKFSDLKSRAEQEAGVDSSGDVIRDEYGIPMRLHHGSLSEFNEFDDSKVQGSDYGYFSAGHYFAPDIERPLIYAGGDMSRVKPAYLRISKIAPPEVSMQAIDKFRKMYPDDLNKVGNEATKYLQSLGYDGAMGGTRQRGGVWENPEYVAFSGKDVALPPVSIGPGAASESEGLTKQAGGKVQPVVTETKLDPNVDSPGLREFYEKQGFTVPDESQPERMRYEPPEKAPETDSGAPPEPPNSSSGTPEPNGRPIGIKNAEVDRLMDEAGLPRSEAAERQSVQQWGKEANDVLQRDSSAPATLVEELKAKPRAVTGPEDVLLARELVSRSNDYDAATEAYNRDPNGATAAARDKAMERYEEIRDVLKTSGTASGRSLFARRIMMNRDYSLARITSGLKAARGGGSFTPDEMEAINKEAQLHSDRLKNADAAEQSAIEAARDRTAQEHAQSEFERIKQELATANRRLAEGGTQKSPLASRIKQVADNFKPKADAAMERIRQKLGRLSAGVDPTILADLAIVGAQKILKGIAAFPKWVAAMNADLGAMWGKVEEHAKDIFEASSRTADEQKRTVGRPQDQVVSKMQARIAGGDNMSDLGRYARRIGEQHVAEGINELNPLIDAVHRDLQKVDPTISRTQARDLFSGYGRFKELDKAPVKVQARDLAQQAQQQAKLEAISRNQAPLRSGIEQHAPSDPLRRMRREVEDAKKSGNLQVTDPTRQVRTAVDALERRLENQLKDLTDEFDLGKRGALHEPPNSARADQLRGMIERVKQSLDEVRERGGNDAHVELKRRHDAAMKALDDSEKVLRQQIETDNYRPDKKTPVTSPELEARRAQVGEIRAVRDDLKRLDDEISGRAQKKRDSASVMRRKQALKNLADRFENGAKQVSRKSPNEAGSELADLASRIRESIKQSEDRPIQHDAHVALMKKAKSALNALDRQEANLRAQIESDSYSTKPAQKMSFPELEEKRAQVSQTRALRDELKALDDEISGRNATKRAQGLQKQIVETQRQIDENVPAKTKMTVDEANARNKGLREIRDNLRQQLAEQRKIAARGGLTDEQMALKRWKSNIEQRTAELKQRTLWSDFDKKPRAPLTPDSDVLAAQAEHKGAQEAFQRALAEHEAARAPGWARGLDMLAKFKRAAVLSYPSTFAKLGASAATRIVLSPLDSAVASAIGHIPGVSRIAENAPRFGGLGANAHRIAAIETASRFIKNVRDAAVTGKTDLDLAYGKPEVSPKSVLDLPVNLHAALKSPAKQFEFSLSLAKRLEWAAKQGEDIRDPLNVNRHAVDAYKDANASIFMDDNVASDAFRKGLVSWLKRQKDADGNPKFSAYALGKILETAMPVVRVPTNIVARIGERVFGTVLGTGRLLNAYRVGIDNLRPEQSDVIMRNLSRGSVGAAALALGYFYRKNIGGFYQRGDQEGVPHGQINNIPAWALHDPLFLTLMVGANMGKLIDKNEAKGQGKLDAAGNAALKTVLDVGSTVPMIRPMIGQSGVQTPANVFDATVGGFIPGALKEPAKWMDKGPNGQPIQRKPQNFTQEIEQNIPGLRKNVPVAAQPVSTKETRRHRYRY